MNEIAHVSSLVVHNQVSEPVILVLIQILVACMVAD